MKTVRELIEYLSKFPPEMEVGQMDECGFIHEPCFEEGVEVRDWTKDDEKEMRSVLPGYATTIRKWSGHVFKVSPVHQERADAPTRKILVIEDCNS